MYRNALQRRPRQGGLLREQRVTPGRGEGSHFLRNFPRELRSQHIRTGHRRPHAARTRGHQQQRRDTPISGWCNGEIGGNGPEKGEGDEGKGEERSRQKTEGKKR